MEEAPPEPHEDDDARDELADAPDEPFSTTRGGLLAVAGGAMLFGLPGKHPKPKRRRLKHKPKPKVKPKPTTPATSTTPGVPPVDPPPVTPPTDPPPVDPTNPIPAENLKQGDTRWNAPWPGYGSDNGGAFIGGFATEVSVPIGGTLDLKVRVPGAQSFNVDVFRLGWYGGLGGRHLFQATGVASHPQPAPVASQTAGGRLLDTPVVCNWSVTTSVPIGADWVSGLYVAVLTLPTGPAAGYQSVVPFLVRDDSRAAPLLFLSAMTNYQAYNNWPDDGSGPGGSPSVGRSLYDSNSAYYPRTIGTGTTARSAARVSFDRPWSRGNGIAQLFDYEAPLVQFLERFGYDVSYAADLDLDQRGEALRHKAIVIAGHSEYWSGGMYDALVEARDAGVSIACFSSNAIYWQVRFEDGRRTVVGYKNRDNAVHRDNVGALTGLNRPDPVGGSTMSERWRDAPLNRDEGGLLGVHYVTNSWCDPRIAGFPLIPTANINHWAYANTGLQTGVPIAGQLAGYEIDTVVGLAQPVGAQDFTILMASPFTGADRNPYTQHTVIYAAPSGAFVFSTGSMGWALGLTPNATLNHGGSYESAGLKRLTQNVLDRMLTA